MVAHLFGATFFPSCASFALRKCAEDNQELFSPKVVDTILHNFYVDHCLVSVGSEEGAVLLYQELRALCAKGGFQLTISSIYDPLGFLAPVVLAAKRIIQDLCRSQLGWDDALTAAAAKERTVWLQELHQLDDFKVNRFLKPLNFGEVASAQLHHFADASEDGYGTVTYLLLRNICRRVHSAFVMRKARVAPFKSITIPGMELTAAVVASRMDKLWRKELRMPLLESGVGVFWTDSTSALKYIKNEMSRFKTFVANWVSEILTLSNSSQWRYVNTSSNPADLASRGAKVESFLKADTWVLGPKFLVEPELKWPVNPDLSGKVSSEDPEIKTIMSVNAVQANEQTDLVMRFISHFSSWNRLKRMVGWLLRFKSLLGYLSRGGGK